MDGGRRSKRRNYRELADLRLPRATRKTPKAATNDLYPVTVIQRNQGQVKVHYIGHSSSYDEWKDVSELETLGETEVQQLPDTVTPIQPFSLYKDFKVKIKLAMSCGRNLTFSSNLHVV